MGEGRGKPDGAARTPYFGSNKRFSLTDKRFSVSDKRFSVMDKRFSMTEKGLSVVQKTYSFGRFRGKQQLPVLATVVASSAPNQPIRSLLNPGLTFARCRFRVAPMQGYRQHSFATAWFYYFSHAQRALC